MSKIKIIGATVGTPTSPAAMEEKIKPVKSVNGNFPDESGNVKIDVPEGSGGAGVHVGPEPPDDPNATFYIDTDDDPDDDPDDSGGGGASAQADWNAAEGEPGHILNRTHWSELVEVIPEQTVAMDEEGVGHVESSLVLVAGETYRVKFDGVVYDCEAWTITEEDVTMTLIGNKALMGLDDDDTGEPFIVATMDGVVQILLVESKPEITFGISVLQHHKIPVQYLHGGVHWIDAVEVDGSLTQITVTPAQTDEAIKAGMDVKLRIYKAGSQDIEYVNVLPCVTYQMYTAVPYTLVFNGRVGLIPMDKTIFLAWDLSSGVEDLGEMLSLPWAVTNGD